MKALPKSIKARVNQMAHRRAQHHALILRDSTLGELQTLAEGGMTTAELSAALDRIFTENANLAASAALTQEK